MTFQCKAFLTGPLGTSVVRHECGSERKAIRWCKRQLQRFEFRKRSVEVRNGRGVVVFTGQQFWPKSSHESCESIAANQGVRDA